jgi:omega-hydroxy-beta-dihydromenaquinone-9 sulfotransferase
VAAVKDEDGEPHRNWGGIAFVVGPGRSGTTLLYKLLCLRPDVAYVSSLQQRLPALPVTLTARLRPCRYSTKLRHWFAAGSNAYFVNRPFASRLIPSPVEGEALYRRCGVPLFPAPDERPDVALQTRLRKTFRQLREASGATVVVSKRTANNRRLEMLECVFPDARYLYVVRDGRDVAASLSRVSWWDDHPLWWDSRHRTPVQAVADGADRLWLCARNWVAETERITRGLERVDPSRVLRVRFEELVSDPVEWMRAVGDFLELPRAEDYESALLGLEFDRPGGDWRHLWSDREMDVVHHEQMAQLRRLGYVS